MDIRRARGSHVSPGIYTKEIDYAAGHSLKSLGKRSIPYGNNDSGNWSDSVEPETDSNECEFGFINQSDNPVITVGVHSMQGSSGQWPVYISATCEWSFSLIESTDDWVKLSINGSSFETSGRGHSGTSQIIISASTSIDDGGKMAKFSFTSNNISKTMTIINVLQLIPSQRTIGINETSIVNLFVWNLDYLIEDGAYWWWTIESRNVPTGVTIDGPLSGNTTSSTITVRNDAATSGTCDIACRLHYTSQTWSWTSSPTWEPIELVDTVCDISINGDIPTYFPSTGGSTSLIVSSNCDWVAYVPDADVWLKIKVDGTSSWGTTVSGPSGTTGITISASSLDGTNVITRSVAIMFVAGGVTKRLIVTQKIESTPKAQILCSDYMLVAGQGKDVQIHISNVDDVSGWYWVVRTSGDTHSVIVSGPGGSLCGNTTTSTISVMNNSSSTSGTITLSVDLFLSDGTKISSDSKTFALVSNYNSDTNPTIQLTLNPDTISRGETSEVTVSVSNVDNISDWIWLIEYSCNVLSNKRQIQVTHNNNEVTAAAGTLSGRGKTETFTVKNKYAAEDRLILNAYLRTSKGAQLAWCRETLIITT